MTQLLQIFKRFVPDGVKRVFWHGSKAFLASLVFGFPARGLELIGVTGTDGKTTTATLIYEILVHAGRSAGLVSTVNYRYADRENSTGLHVTSPEPFELQKMLWEMRKAGVKTVVLETTSHGLDQLRFWGMKFRVGVLTNVTREHLDWHRTMEKYKAAKNRLFAQSETVILNRDDSSFSFFQKRRRPDQKMVTYGVKSKADFTRQTFGFKTLLLGEFNQANCLAAIATVHELGVSAKQIREVVSTFSGVKGRLEAVPNKKGFRVYVDFAHTPNALEQVLKTLRSETGKKLIAVFGSAGKRDRGKRPLMGAAAAHWADLIILTADDPRDEPVEEINRQIGKGAKGEGAKETRELSAKSLVSKKPVFISVPDRREAIRLGLKTARRGDIVALCGKGHEQSLSVGEKEIEWSDFEVAKEELARLKN